MIPARLFVPIPRDSRARPGNPGLGSNFLSAEPATNASGLKDFGE